MRTVRTLAAILLALIVPARFLEAQAVTPPVVSTISVYLDCRAGCDGNFLRTEINYVNWVRDREVADVQLLITGQDGGAGGEQFTLAFIGLRTFAGRGDTLTFNTNPTTTDDEERKLMAQTVSLGLVHFAAHTSAGQTLRISSSTSGTKDAGQEAAQKNDKWNAWVFEISVNGFLNGEASYKGRDINMGLQANRVTERWKTEMEYNFRYNDNSATVQEFDDSGNVTSSETFTNVQRDWNFEWLQVKSMSDHFSLGGQLEVAQQTFRNQDLRSEVRGAFEYNLFPYKESTRRELSFRYGLGLSSFRYVDTTIFGKISESLPSQFAEVSLNVKQPWGNVNLNLEHKNFLTDASKRTSSINANWNFRLFKGFNFNGGGGYEWINDQIYLPAESSNAVDVFLRRRALLTSYSYYTYFGISYTFGSIYNNVVNPRF